MSEENSTVPDLGLGQPEVRSLHTPNLLDLLIRTLDTFIFLEICVLYCCDNLTFLLALRALSQVIYIQPKPGINAFGGALLAPTVVANLACMITHFIHARPEAIARSAHGYIHGGLLIDFVGELGPISKWRLISLDFVIAGLQILMLMIGHEKRNKSGENNTASPRQDIEAEEEGVRRSQEGRDDIAADEDGIEMDRLLPSGSRESASSPSGRDADDDMIANIDIKQTLRSLSRRSTAPSSNTAVDVDDRIARVRRLLGRAVADRVAAST